jgi:tetratricopeptide (TPR) repeat protein
MLSGAQVKLARRSRPRRASRPAAHSAAGWLVCVGLTLGSARARAQAAEVLSFIGDDYPRALALARTRHVPLFVDAWAPWCHTCLSLRAYVFTDPSLSRWSSRFVWLSLDTERERNEAVVAKLGVHELPTLFVVDPATEAVVVARPGSLTASELAAFLDEALRSLRQEGDRADFDLRRGHRAGAEGRLDEAIAAYRAAIAEAPPSWSSRSEAIDALVTHLHDAKRRDECARTAADAVGSMPGGTARADVVRVGIECATEADDVIVDAGVKSVDAVRDPTRLAALTAFGERMAGDPAEPILADDRSDLFDFVFEGWKSLGRSGDAQRVARAWAQFLEGQAARAASPAARVVFDAHRVAAYLALGTPARALPMLEESARDFPADYNPPARMARAYLALGRADDAIASLERALGLAYGPRKLSLWSLEADAYLAKGDRAGARRALESALAFADAQPLTGGYGKLRGALRARLAALPP